MCLLQTAVPNLLDEKNLGANCLDNNTNCDEVNHNSHMVDMEDKIEVSPGNCELLLLLRIPKSIWNRNPELLFRSCDSVKNFPSLAIHYKRQRSHSIGAGQDPRGIAHHLEEHR